MSNTIWEIEVYTNTGFCVHRRSASTVFILVQLLMIKMAKISALLLAVVSKIKKNRLYVLVRGHEVMR